MRNRFFLSTRRHQTSSALDRMRSIFGYDVVYRYLTTTTTTTKLSISPSICNNLNANDGTIVRYSSKDFWQQQRHRQQQQQQQQQQIRQHQSSQIIYSDPFLRRCNNSRDNNQHHKRFQFRCFAFDSRKVRKRKKSKNPFKVLKVKEGMLYKDVKIKFLKIAMNNHPDTYHSSANDDINEKEQQEKMRNTFINARIAFEALTVDTDGTAILVTDTVDEEENFDSWFKNETGHKNPFDVDIDPETMKEVAKMTEDVGGDQGLDRDGGSKLLVVVVVLLLFCTFCCCYCHTIQYIIKYDSSDLLICSVVEYSFRWQYLHHLLCGIDFSQLFLYIRYIGSLNFSVATSPNGDIDRQGWWRCSIDS